jgi:hypothetical protein
MTEGIRIFTELTKPTLMPVHLKPVHAENHAVSHGCSVGARGRARIALSLISSMLFSEVTTIT